MDKFFCPSSVAVVGASAKEGKTGHAVLENIINGGFEGDIYPINPRESEIMGKVVYKSLSETPEVADLAIIVIPAPFVPQVVKEAAEHGVKNFVIITAGFGEIGEEGAHLDEALKVTIEAHGLNVMGPNCLGVIAPHAKLNASFGGDIPAKGNVALLSQSGAIVSSLCDWAGIRHFGFSKVVSLGNKLQLEENACLEYLAEDDETDVIVLFLKKFKDKARFLALAKEISKTKAIILYKSGTKSADDEILNKELAEAGVIRANSLEELYDLTHICSSLPVARGNKTTVITNAGGPGVIAQDAIEDSEVLEFAEFGEEVKAELIAALPAEALPVNPIDLIGDAKADLYEASLDIVLRNEATDSLMVILCPQAMTEATESAKKIIAAKEKYPDLPIISCFVGGVTVQEARNLLQENGIPCFLDPARTVWALEVLNFLGERRNDQE